MIKKNYEIEVAVLNQGDDLNDALNLYGDSVKDAFNMLAKQYEEAAKIFKRVASVAADVPELDVIFSGNDRIVLSAPDGSLDGLISDNIISLSNWKFEPDDYDNRQHNYDDDNYVEYDEYDGYGEYNEYNEYNEYDGYDDEE
jgi:hypothetical protein